MTWHLTPKKDDTVDESCQGAGSGISCENQSLGEAVGVVGTPFALHYQSDRVPGRALANSQAIAHAQGLGGWTLSVHHAYDPSANALYLGSGERRDAVALGAVTRQADGGFLIAAEDTSEVYMFDPSGRHLRTRHALTGASLYEFAYDSQERLASITDANGNVTTIERAANGQPLAIGSPFGLRTTLTVDTNSYLASIANPAGERVALSSTPEGLLTQLIDPNHHVSRFRYDDTGRLIRDEDAAGGFQELSRTTHSDGSYTVRRTTGDGRITEYQVALRPGGGEDRLIIHPTGLQANVTRTSEAAQAASSPAGVESSSVLGADPRFGRSAPIIQGVSITTPSDLNFVGSMTRAVALTNAADPFSLAALTETHTLNGRTYTSAYNGATKTFIYTTPAGRQEITLIDAKGRVVQEQTTGLFPLSYTYDARGRLASITQGTDAGARTLTLSYNTEGYLASVIDPLGRAMSYAYDAAGRLTREILSNGQEILYGYDANGNRISLTPPGRPAHVFAYTPVDLPGAYMPPAVAGSGSTLYTYNLDKDLTRIISPNGQTLDGAYDGAGRLKSLTIPSGQFSYAYNAMTGMLQRITTPDGDTLDYTFDGALLTKTRWAGAVAGEVDFAYDNDFRVTSMRVNGVEPIILEYDADGFLVKAGSLSLSRRAENGLLARSTLGGVSDSLTYNGFGEITDYRAAFNGIALLALQSTRDQLGRITQKVESLGGVTATFEYTYDVAGHLIEVTRNGTPLASYTYDGNGNRLTGPGITTPATYDAQDRLLESGGSTYTYTGAGELASKTTGAFLTAYQYDVLGNLKHVTLPSGQQIDYVIDGNNRRVGKKIDGTLVQGFVYQDRLNPIAELDGVNNVVSRFVYATHVNVPDYMVKGGVTYRILTDHLGSPRLVVNTTDGTIAQRMDYDEFGRVLLDTNPGFQPFGFAGGLYDRETKLVRFGARDYDAETGRWTAKDPILFAGGDTNLYVYTFNDPINFVDADGWQPASKRSTPKRPQVGGRATSAYGAAMMALKQYQQPSGRMNCEHAGMICKVRGKKELPYLYTKPQINPNIDQAWASDPGTCPAGSKPAAWYHTHGRAQEGNEAGDEHFSSGDKGVTRRLGVDAYLGTPRGTLGVLPAKGGPPRYWEGALPLAPSPK